MLLVHVLIPEILSAEIKTLVYSIVTSCFPVLDKTDFTASCPETWDATKSSLCAVHLPYMLP
jgi:hypothetical protein